MDNLSQYVYNEQLKLMIYNFSSFKQGIKEVEAWLSREFGGIRTGRATAAILDGIKVDAYGSEMAVRELGSISVEDARSLRIIPWDMSQAKAIEKAIALSNLGLSMALDDKGVRVTFPDLTTERRSQLVKFAKQKLEDARITLRSEREKVWKDIETGEREGKIAEDDKFRFKTELQKMVDEAGKVLEESFAKKEKEISE